MHTEIEKLLLMQSFDKISGFELKNGDPFETHRV